MSKALFFDQFAGCSGDMILGALLDTGLPLEEIETRLATVPLSGYQIVQKKVKRGSIYATIAEVHIDKQPAEHHRSYQDIALLITGSELTAITKQRALCIIRALAESEAGIHGVPIEQVHFHEVGAIDSIVDIIGACIGFDLVEVNHFYSSPFLVTEGITASQHGTLPLPAPATISLIANKHAPIRPPSIGAMEGHELVTPTGAAIIVSLAKFITPPMNLQKVGYGAGTRDAADYPNILRILIGDIADTIELDKGKYGHEAATGTVK